MDNRRFYTYAWLREDGTPYYIGKGTERRAYRGGGRKRNRQPPKDKSRILILKKNLTEEEAFKHEIYMIALYGRKDLGTGILINLTNGGDGIRGLKGFAFYRSPDGTEQTMCRPGEEPKGWIKGRNNAPWEYLKKPKKPPYTKAERSERARKAQARRNPEERRESAIRGNANMTEEQRAKWKENMEMAKKSRPPEVQREIVERMKKTKTERSGKSVEITTPEGEKLVFPALREASRQTGLHPYVLRRLLNNEGATSQQGHTARFL